MPAKATRRRVRPGMAKNSKTDALWREAWTASSYRGVVELEGDHLVIRNEEVVAEYGFDARILDDGRTVGVALGDHVAFGIVERSSGKAPVAVNVWRSFKKRKSEEDGDWNEWKGDFDYTSSGKAGPGAEDLDDPLPPSCRGDLVGLVRHQSERTGHYWIECQPVYEAFGRDASIRCFDMPPNLRVGDPIVFRVVRPRFETQPPQCINVRKAIGSKAEEAFAMGYRGQQWDQNKGKGKGKNRSAGATAAMRMIGVVKKKSLNTDRRFVFCQDISDVYGVDAQIPVEELPAEDMPVGTRIAFDLDEPPDSKATAIPFCRNVTIIGKRGTRGTAAADEEEGEDADDDIVFDEEKSEAEEEEPVKKGRKKPEEEVVEDETGFDELEAADAGAADDGEDEALPPRLAPPLKRQKTDGDPDSVEGWIIQQNQIFHGMPKLQKNWIRIRSKSTGLVYYYNVESGESTTTEPLV